MNDLVPGARVEGTIRYHGGRSQRPEGRSGRGPAPDRDGLSEAESVPEEYLRQHPWGAKINGFQGQQDELVERSLRQAALWDEVKDKLQRERIVAFRRSAAAALHRPDASPINPDVILMDEPCSALDPISTLKIEDLMRELERQYTIVIVTHNMQQAARVSDQTVFFSLNEQRQGILVEASPTRDLFTNPRDQRTEDYITGRFG